MTSGLYCVAAKHQNRKKRFDPCRHLDQFLAPEAEEAAIAAGVKGPTVRGQQLVLLTIHMILCSFLSNLHDQLFIIEKSRIVLVVNDKFSFFITQS